MNTITNQVEHLVVGKQTLRKADMYRLVNKLRNANSQQTEYDRILNKILKVLESSELKNRLDGTEQDAYNKFIMPLVDKQKCFPIPTGILFASLVAMVSSYDKDFLEDIIRHGTGQDADSKGWIAKIDEYKTKLIEYYINIQYEYYLNQKESEKTQASKIQDTLLQTRKFNAISCKYIYNKESFKHELQQYINTQYERDFNNLNSICRQIVNMNYDKCDNKPYQKKFEQALNLFKSLPVDIRATIFSNNSVINNIDFMYNTALKYVES